MISVQLNPAWQILELERPNVTPQCLLFFYAKLYPFFSSFSLTVYKDMQRMSWVPVELLLTREGTPRPNIHNTLPPAVKVSLHMKIYILQSLLLWIQSRPGISYTRCISYGEVAAFYYCSVNVVHVCWGTTIDLVYTTVYTGYTVLYIWPSYHTN